MIKELRTKTDNELGNLISKLKVQLLEMRFKIANGEVEGIHKFKEIKKTIAMAMTVLSERNVKISFSTFSTQLIKNKNGKQEIVSLSIVEEKKDAVKSQPKPKQEQPKKENTSENKTEKVKVEAVKKDNTSNNKKVEVKNKPSNKPVTPTKNSKPTTPTAKNVAAKKPASKSTAKTPAKGSK